MTHEITYTHRFAASHTVRLPDGTTEASHEHDWSVEVTLTAPELDEFDMVMDFHSLDEMLRTILAPIRGKFMNKVPPFADEQGNPIMNTTTERVAWWLGETLLEKLPKRVTLVSVMVGEAPGCSATWRP